MRTHGIQGTFGWKRALAPCVIAVAAIFGLGGAAFVHAGDEPKVQAVGSDTAATTIKTGSGQRYTTTVERAPGGELSAEDFRQVSLLASRIVMHLNDGVRQMSHDRADEARAEVEKGISLVRVIREILPTTVVTTVVRDASGKEVYRNVDRVQDHRIPLHEGTIAMQVLEPIADAKQEDLAARGVQLADAQLIHTSVLLELDYVEGKLQRALKLLGEDRERAQAEMVLAQARGITFAVNEEDDPLVEAQSALQLAERMVEQGRYEAAKANLSLASARLDLYATLVPKESTGRIAELQDDIARLSGDIRQEGSAKKIRSFWDRVASWFRREPGETRSADREEAKAPAKAAAEQ